MMQDVLLKVTGLVMIFGPFIHAVLVLGKLDAAAKLRKKALGKQRFRFMIVDFFSLILLVQMPFKFLAFDIGRGLMIFSISVSLIAVVLIWFTTIKTVSQAGIVVFGWRSLVSMVVVPTMYIGSFYFGIGSVNFFSGQLESYEAIVWMVVVLLSMIASPWIVRGALRSASQPLVSEATPKVTDPFAD